MSEKIGFFEGVSMIWTAAIGASVKSLQAVDSTAGATLNVTKSAEAGSGVMLANVKNWEADALIKAEMVKSQANQARLAAAH